MCPSPIERGEARVWVAGVVYAIGQTNFLFDSSQKPNLSAGELSDLVRVPKSTETNGSGGSPYA